MYMYVFTRETHISFSLLSLVSLSKHITIVPWDLVCGYMEATLVAISMINMKAWNVQGGDTHNNMYVYHWRRVTTPNCPIWIFRSR